MSDTLTGASKSDPGDTFIVGAVTESGVGVLVGVAVFVGVTVAVIVGVFVGVPAGRNTFRTNSWMLPDPLY